MKCFICRSLKIKHLLNPRRGWSIYLCARCANAFTIPPPKLSYEENEFYLSSKNDESLFRRYAQQIIATIKKYARSGHLLDVGTGGGLLLKEATQTGFLAEGIKPSKKAVEHCRKLNLKVKQGYLNKISFRKNSFDVVVLSHVLEHCDKPDNFLSSVKYILKPDGIIFLSQTNFTGTIPKMLGSFWEGWVLNEHFVQFSPEGIEYFLRKCGFKVIDLNILPLGYNPQWKWGNMSVLANNIYQTINFIISRFRIGFPFSGDQMFVVAQNKQL